MLGACCLKKRKEIERHVTAFVECLFFFIKEETEKHVTAFAGCLFAFPNKEHFKIDSNEKTQVY